MFYEFSEFRLDIQQRLLSAGADGRPIPLPPKVFETLLYFVERHGELLDKTTLMKAVWPNVVVEENSLNQNISVIRRALGESPGEHRFIVTEPGRGYRFVADVRAVAAAGSDGARVESGKSSTPAGRAAPAGAAAATAAQRKSIAVLPFANMTGDPSKEYFSDGMSEELLNRLARIPGLKVPSRTSSFSYKGRNIDVRQIARDLDVGVVLEGSVRSAGERIRVTAQLIDGHNGFHLWSQNYDRDFGDLFALQDELAHAIVNTLRVTIDGKLTASEVIGPSLQEAPTRDIEAYKLYLQALSTQMIGAPSIALPRAIAMLNQAIERDPGFARAYNAIASLRALAITVDIPLPGTLADAERDILRGLARDSSLGATHAALGVIYAAQGNWISADERYLDAFTRDVGDPQTQQSYGMILQASVGYLRGYLDHTLEAHRLAPVWVGNLVNVAIAYMFVEQPERARHFADLGVALGIAHHRGSDFRPLFAACAARRPLRRGSGIHRGSIAADLRLGWRRRHGKAVVPLVARSNQSRRASRRPQRFARTRARHRDDANDEAALHALVHNAGRARSGIRDCQPIVRSICHERHHRHGLGIPLDARNAAVQAGSALPVDMPAHGPVRVLDQARRAG